MGHFFVQHLSALEVDHEAILITFPSNASVSSWVRGTLTAVHRTRPDVIHAHGALPGGLAALVAGRAYGARVVLTEHNGPVHRLFAGSAARRRVVMEIFRAVDALVTPSAAAARDIARWVPGRRVVTIANPVPLSPEPRKAPPPLLFASAGMMEDRVKGYAYLLAAWTEFVATQPTARLTIIGDGVLLRDYKALSRRLGISESVSFTGYLSPSDALRVIMSADAFVAASIHESFGYAAAEAAMCGKPLVATGVGIIPEIAEPRTAIVVAPGRADSLAAGLIDYANGRERFDRRRLRQRAIAHFGFDVVRSTTTKLYERLTDSGRIA